jgi:hypothetical protein
VRAHVPEEGGADGVERVMGGGGGRTGQGSTAGEAPLRFSAGVPVLRRGSGSEAWAGVEDHGGGTNLGRRVPGVAGPW